VRLTVADDGVGFDVNTPPKYDRGSGLGLVGMRERVALVGGCVRSSRSRSGHAHHDRIADEVRKYDLDSHPSR